MKILAIVLLTFSLNVVAQEIGSELDAYLEESEFSGVGFILYDSETVWSGSFGFSNYENFTPNTSETRFRIGSNTKQFTAMAIQILAERGELSLSDNINEHIDGLPQSWESITIDQLVHHTSGLIHSWSLPGFQFYMDKQFTLDEMIAKAFDEPLIFEPGSEFSYSGVGYFLLAKTIENVSSLNYETFLRVNIFEPLEMHSTGADSPEIDRSNHAKGYRYRKIDKWRTTAPSIHLPNLPGGGNLYSSASDMKKWGLELINRSLLTQASYTEIFNPELGNYGFGWTIESIRGMTTVRHTGGVPGFDSYIAYIPSKKLIFFLTSNQSPTEGAWPLFQPAVSKFFDYAEQL